MMHLYCNGNPPTEIEDLLCVNYSLNPYNTWGRNLFYLPEKNTAHERMNSVSYNSPSRWNFFCRDTNNEFQDTSISQFKMKVKEYFIQKYL